jgi:hypothetical protein
VEGGLVNVYDLFFTRHEEAGKLLAERLLVIRDFAEVALLLRVDKLGLAVLDLAPVVVISQGIGRELCQVEFLAHSSCSLFQVQVAPLLEDLRILQIVYLLPGKHSSPASLSHMTRDGVASLPPAPYDVGLRGRLHSRAVEHLLGAEPGLAVVMNRAKAKVYHQRLR